MTITEKVAYLKGLIDGLDIDKTTKEGKVLMALTDVIEDIALTVADNCDQIDAVDEDLDALEEYVYDDDEDFFDDDEDYCANCDGCDDDFDYEEYDYGITCPNCHQTIYVDKAIIDEGKMVCPACGAEIEPIEDEEEEEDNN